MIPHSNFRINGTLNFITNYGEEFIVRRRFDTMYVFTIFDRDGFEVIKLDKKINDIGNLSMLRTECVHLIKDLMKLYDDDLYMEELLKRFIKSITGE